MKNASSKTATSQVRKLEPFDKTRIDFSKFKLDLTTENLKDLLKLPGNVIIFPPFFFPPIETLSATKTIGRGRTNLTIIMPTIVQVDSATPSATFDRQTTPSRDPVIQMHFEPSAYGITSVATYIMEFTIVTFGQSSFILGGFAGAGAVLNAGTKVLSGQTRVSLILQNVPASQQTFGFLQQTGGAPWSWFSTQVRFPPLVFTKA